MDVCNDSDWHFFQHVVDNFVHFCAELVFDFRMAASSLSSVGASANASYSSAVITSRLGTRRIALCIKRRSSSGTPV